jgi:hypothetical protein
MCVIVWTDEWCDPAVHRQSEWACGGSEGSGGAGSSCEPSQCGVLLHVFSGAGVMYPLDGLWFVGVGVVVGRWHASENGVWCAVVDKGGETRLTLCSHAGMHGWVCMWSARG